jgi:hypothetical protein
MTGSLGNVTPKLTRLLPLGGHGKPVVRIWRPKNGFGFYQNKAFVLEIRREDRQEMREIRDMTGSLRSLMPDLCGVPWQATESTPSLVR